MKSVLSVVVVLNVQAMEPVFEVAQKSMIIDVSEEHGESNRNRNMKYFIFFWSLLLMPISVHASSISVLSEKEAGQIVSNLPEVRNYLKEQKGRNPSFKSFATVEEGWEPLGDSYYVVAIGELKPTHTVTWERFFIHKKTREILVYDVLHNKPLTLEKWRKGR